MSRGLRRVKLASAVAAIGAAAVIAACAPSGQNGVTLSSGDAPVTEGKATETRENSGPARTARHVDDGLRLDKVSRDGRKITITIEDDPCFAATLDDVKETSEEVQIVLSLETPVNDDPEAACLPVLRHTQHVLDLRAPLADRRLVRRVSFKE